MWVENREVETDGVTQHVNMVMHEFYSKEVASKAVVHQRSALSKQCKRIIMTQEVLRVLLNCSRLLPWEQTVSHVNSMVVRMQYSGYDQQFRYEVVRSAIDAYRRILAMDQQAIRPLYREKEWKKAERESEKKKKKRTERGTRLGIRPSLVLSLFQQHRNQN